MNDTTYAAREAGQSDQLTLRAVVEVRRERTDTRLSFGEGVKHEDGTEAVKQAIAALQAEFDGRHGCPAARGQSAGQCPEDLHGRAWVAAEYRVAGSPHEWTDEDSLAMARFILAGPRPGASDSTCTGKVETGELRSLISEAADAVFAIGRATPSEQQVDRAYTAAERLLDYRDRNLSEAALAARSADPEAQGAWVQTTERFVIAVREFLADWRKGDFLLPTLAALDAESIEAALEDWAGRLPAPPSSGQEETL
ncbi:hypothetical protein [Methylobacterium sp. R2-1]|uniref:hypothetical protein n=1 Tax=Methylobacterium sp. R2-1 TaxID=2587064 RepID=UPI00161ED071|nr:hypothetical protein [Methylobacterium sp. R2-1]MBB2959909.1 hypothetical protein [Methylobacterium sp. R2-1]